MSEIKECLDAKGRELPSGHCPVCQYEFDAATCCEGDHRPKAGDMTLCLKCGEILTFDEAMRAVVPSLDHLLTLDKPTESLLMRAQRLIRQTRPKG